jgi:CRP-like cAMP-binding protein
MSPSSHPSIRTNRLLSALQPDDFMHLERDIQPVELRKGAVVYETNEPMPFVYFPHNALVSFMTVLPDGKAMEMAMLGCDTMFSQASALTTRRSPGRYVVQIAGKASRISTDVLHRAFEERPSLREFFLRYQEAFLAESLQTMACNTAHNIVARCSRWLLTMRDRTGQAALPFTHEHLSQMLGVQRSTVSLVTSELQSSGLISQSRGAITVADGSGLEQITCGCYEVARRRFKQLSSAQGHEVDDV